MITISEIRKARLEALIGAGNRWNQRKAERNETTRKLIERGEGGADSQKRQAQFTAREFRRTTAVSRLSEGRLPFDLERIIGPSIDWVGFAPSDAARMAGRPVARIVVMPGQGYQAEGLATGFMVTPSLLLTNHHVLPSKTSAAGLGANFRYEADENGVQSGVIFELRPEEFYLADRKLDFAIVAVASRSTDGAAVSEFGVVRLIEATPKILLGQPVNIIQHPDGGPKKYAVAENKLVDILDSGFIHYTTDTRPGSSGSPAFNKAWELVGLHHSGVPEIRNGRIWTAKRGPWDPEKMDDDDIHWVANEGIRVSSIVGMLKATRLDDPRQQQLLKQLLDTTSDPLETATGSLTNSDSNLIQPSNNENMANNVFNFTGPVTIHIYSGGAPALPAASVTPPEAVALATEAAIRFDKDYKARKGYDEKFLGVSVPMPTVTGDRAGEIQTGGDGKPLVLKYHHYSLVMNAQRRLQMWSAVNIDYSPDRRSDRSRKEFGTDKWIPDPRIRGEEQIVDEEFYKPATKIDRGHIVRREDNAWGDDEEEIEFANSDTFHWTNCTPQHEAFNRESPGKGYSGVRGLWGEFETYVKKQLEAKDQKCCMLSGPVLAKDDPSVDFGYGAIQYPIRFWKVVAVEKGGKLGVYGFVFSQEDVIEDYGIEFTPGRFRRYQKSLKVITDITGVVFDESLHAADDKREA